jgi:hypothetical protein
MSAQLPSSCGSRRCPVAAIPATFQSQKTGSSNDVISNGNHNPIGVFTRPRDPFAIRREPHSTPTTEGPQAGHCSVSIRISHTLTTGAWMIRVTCMA